MWLCRQQSVLEEDERPILISALQKQNPNALSERILHLVHADEVKAGDTIATNIRHYDSLMETQKALDDVMNGINNNITGDFLALDIRTALHHLGEITGEITTDDLLANIFSKFCIGK